MRPTPKHLERFFVYTLYCVMPLRSQSRTETRSLALMLQLIWNGENSGRPRTVTAAHIGIRALGQRNRGLHLCTSTLRPRGATVTNSQGSRGSLWHHWFLDLMRPHPQATRVYVLQGHRPRKVISDAHFVGRCHLAEDDHYDP